MFRGADVPRTELQVAMKSVSRMAILPSPNTQVLALDRKPEAIFEGHTLELLMQTRLDRMQDYHSYLAFD